MAALSGGTVAASSYPPGDPTPSTVGDRRAVAGIRQPEVDQPPSNWPRPESDTDTTLLVAGAAVVTGSRLAGRRTMRRRAAAALTTCTAAWSGRPSVTRHGHVATACSASHVAGRCAAAILLPRSPGAADRLARRRRRLPRRRDGGRRPRRRDWRRGGPSPSRPASRWPSPPTPLLMAAGGRSPSPPRCGSGATRRDRPGRARRRRRSDPQRLRPRRARARLRHVGVRSAVRGRSPCSSLAGFLGQHVVVRRSVTVRRRRARAVARRRRDAGFGAAAVQSRHDLAGGLRWAEQGVSLARERRLRGGRRVVPRGLRACLATRQRADDQAVDRRRGVRAGRRPAPLGRGGHERRRCRWRGDRRRGPRRDRSRRPAHRRRPLRPRRAGRARGPAVAGARRARRPPADDGRRRARRGSSTARTYELDDFDSQHRRAPAGAGELAAGDRSGARHARRRRAADLPRAVHHAVGGRAGSAGSSAATPS